MKHDSSIENLLELDGVKFVIDEFLGLWVKFEVTQVEQNKHRPHSIKYSLTLHDRFNKRIMGFDNAHKPEYRNRSSEQTYDHWHRNEYDIGRSYYYQSAVKLLEDFWVEVDKIVQRLRESKNEG